MTVWGLGIAQNIDAAATDVYVGYRHMDADITCRAHCELRRCRPDRYDRPSADREHQRDRDGAVVSCSEPRLSCGKRGDQLHSG